jgi:hypothetical protein
MISRYRTQATTADELGLGALVSLHLAIPELAELSPGVGEGGGNVIHVNFGR